MSEFTNKCDFTANHECKIKVNSQKKCEQSTRNFDIFAHCVMSHKTEYSAFANDYFRLHFCMDIIVGCYILVTPYCTTKLFLLRHFE